MWQGKNCLIGARCNFKDGTTVLSTVCPQVGKSVKIGFDTDESFENFKVQCMNRYRKRHWMNAQRAVDLRTTEKKTKKRW